VVRLTEVTYMYMYRPTYQRVCDDIADRSDVVEEQSLDFAGTVCP